ncbi:hypothetical protein HanRHA438_Chr05g0222011 [Helianthus annuus]|nr:hypothetical protein HanRHA438_Chr05g0222011 [Helianthus annuus]
MFHNLMYSWTGKVQGVKDVDTQRKDALISYAKAMLLYSLFREQASQSLTEPPHPHSISPVVQYHAQLSFQF